VRRDVKVVPFGLWLEQYLQYRGLGRVFDMGIVSPLVLYKGILDVLEALRLVRRRLRGAVVGGGLLRDAMSLDHSVSLVFRVSEKERRRILAQNVYYLHLLLPRGLAYRRFRPFRWGCILSFWLLNTIL